MTGGGVFVWRAVGNVGGFGTRRCLERYKTYVEGTVDHRRTLCSHARNATDGRAMVSEAGHMFGASWGAVDVGGANWSAVALVRHNCSVGSRGGGSHYRSGEGCGLYSRRGNESSSLVLDEALLIDVVGGCSMDGMM